MLLPYAEVPKGAIRARYIFGVSRASDIDNLVKAFQDALAEKYGFNDNRIYFLEVQKVVVKKGEEFIDFELKSVENGD